MDDIWHRWLRFTRALAGKDNIGPQLAHKVHEQVIRDRQRAARALERNCVETAI
ncbi:hypothetical protein [Bradyrhizobium archetypum]|uniref:Uncharacterized protein n=1 Tax=Bradyrhizobium archetypum TaxID=2721160 RepID=A0A7Y4H942_9BRAD|nr:hypothetical protein [Bradyrhizobium archetypum]NOJ49017.1 hypothetical protein [Bradyrhizobium archetypum]